MPVRKKKPTNILLTVLSIILLLLIVLKFDVVVSAIDPGNKLGISGFVSDAFPIVLGITLIVVGIAAAASVWVAVALIAVGVIMLASRLYSIWKRNKTTTLNEPV
jgi:hypothetical protein